MSSFVDVKTRVAFSGDKMKKQNLFDSERMFCDVYCFEPGQTQAAHAHAGSDKIYYVLDGTAEIQIGDETRTVGPGSAAHAAPGVAHAVANPGPDRLTVLVFMAPKP
ncbi:MAG: cupin domain-containing protein [Thermodesulfobacteriota bacterium]